MQVAGFPAGTVSLEASACISSCRVLCETVKDFVARVGKAYEKTTESSEESEVMAKKVCPLAPWLGGCRDKGGAPFHSILLFVPFPVLCPVREAGFSPQDLGRRVPGLILSAHPAAHHC